MSEELRDAVADASGCGDGEPFYEKLYERTGGDLFTETQRLIEDESRFVVLRECGSPLTSMEMPLFESAGRGLDEARRTDV